MIRRTIGYSAPEVEVLEIPAESICTGSDGVPGFSGDKLIDDSEDYN